MWKTNAKCTVKQGRRLRRDMGLVVVVVVVVVVVATGNGNSSRSNVVLQVVSDHMVGRYSIGQHSAYRYN